MLPIYVSRNYYFSTSNRYFPNIHCVQVIDSIKPEAFLFILPSRHLGPGPLSWVKSQFSFSFFLTPAACLHRSLFHFSHRACQEEGDIFLRSHPFCAVTPNSTTGLAWMGTTTVYPGLFVLLQHAPWENANFSH